MIYGYARVSTHGQALKGYGLERQSEMLKNAGCGIIYSDVYTGTKADRPELRKLLEVVSTGDEVVVAKLDRIARSVTDGIGIIDELNARGVTVRVLNMGVFDNTPTGKLCRNMMLAFAEFERDMIVQRTSEGRRIARNKPGYKEGRPKLEIAGLAEMQKKVAEGVVSVTARCKELGISRNTWYRVS